MKGSEYSQETLRHTHTQEENSEPDRLENKKEVQKERGCLLATKILLVLQDGTDFQH